TDLPLVHRLEQSALRARARAIDLIGENQLMEQRPFFEHELLGLGTIDRDADQVGGEQVTGELDALKRAADRAREGGGQGGLADTGNILDEQMAARDETDHGPAYRRGLPFDHALDVLDETADAARLRHDSTLTGSRYWMAEAAFNTASGPLERSRGRRI